MQPLPWNSNYGKEYQQRSIADHIMKKNVSSNAFFDQNTEVLLQEWNDAVNPKPPKILPPVKIVLSQEKPKINAKNYSVERLLHPWQRGIDNLRKEVQNRSNSVDLSSHEQLLHTILENEASPPQISSHEDDDSDDEVLGWNPFVITVDGNNRVTINN